MVKGREHIRIVDLFAGIGGLSSGVQKGLADEGYASSIVFTSEFKTSAVKVLQANHEGLEVSGDITQIREDEVPSHDLLLAGFPCQAFSRAGKRRGFEDTRGTLFFDVARILKHHKPKYFILENVANLITHDPYPKRETSPYGDKIGRTLTVILDTLKELGYHVDWELLNAADFGVPQSRERVFIYGSTSPLPEKSIHKHNKKAQLKDIIVYGTPPHSESPKETEWREKLEKHYGVANLAGKNINDKRGGNNNIHSWDFKIKGPISKDGQDLMNQFLLQRRKKSWAAQKGTPNKDGVLLTEKDIATFYTGKTPLRSLLDSLTKHKYLRMQDGAYNLGSGRLSFPYSRIFRDDEVTVTATATDTNRMGIVDGEHIRRFTPVEYKRLFGFSDDFIIPEELNKNAVYDLFGNSVVVNVARAVARRLLP